MPPPPFWLSTLGPFHQRVHVCIRVLVLFASRSVQLSAPDSPVALHQAGHVRVRTRHTPILRSALPRSAMRCAPAACDSTFHTRCRQEAMMGGGAGGPVVWSAGCCVVVAYFPIGSLPQDSGMGTGALGRLRRSELSTNRGNRQG